MPNLLADVLSRGGTFILGVLIVFVTTLSLMRTVVIPRSLRSLISDVVAKVIIGITVGLSRLRRRYTARDGVLAWTGPSIIIAQLLTWLVLYLIGYGLMIYGTGGQTMGDSMREAGSSLFTLRCSAVNTEDQTIINFMAAATGPIVIAMLIGFLPTIYSAYLDREVDVTMLSATGGEPAWGPELLARFSLARGLDGLGPVFLGWAQWSTRMRMTHVTYPVLVWVRSTRAERHYIVSLMAMMDAAALTLALTKDRPHKEAMALLLEGGQTMEILYIFLFGKRGWTRKSGFTGHFTGATSQAQPSIRALPGWNRRLLAIQVASDMDVIRGLDQHSARALQHGEEHPLRVTREDFDHAVQVLRESEFPIDTDLDEAWEQFRIARLRYEFAALEICYRLDATPAPWTGERRVPTEIIWPTHATAILPLIEGDDSDKPES